MNDDWPIHTIVFDLDDTLFAEAEYNESGFQAAGALMRDRCGLEGLAATATALFRAGTRGRIFDAALQELNVPANPKLVAELVQAYRSHVPRLTMLPDAAACLDWASSRFRLALLSDGYLDVQRKKLGALGIADRFMCCVFTDALGRECWKPSSVGFQRIMAQLPGAAAGYVYVGDNPRKDFIGPRLLGWRTMRIRRRSGEHGSYTPAPNEAAEVELAALTDMIPRLRSVAP